MKRYVYCSEHKYETLNRICSDIKTEILDNLNEVAPEYKWWFYRCTDEGAGDVKVSFGVWVNWNDDDTYYPTLSETNKLFRAAVDMCSDSTRNKIVKVIRAGQSGGRNRMWNIISVIVTPSTNEYYGI